VVGHPGFPCTGQRRTDGEGVSDQDIFNFWMLMLSKIGTIDSFWKSSGWQKLIKWNHSNSLLSTTATDHQEPHPHPNPPPEGEGILWGFFPTWRGFYGFFSLSWKFFQSLPFQGGGQEGDGVYMSL